MVGCCTEQSYENAIIEIMESNLDYTYIHGKDIMRDEDDPLYIDELREALKRINKNLPITAINSAVLKIQNIEGEDLIHKNMRFMDYLQNGLSIKYIHDGEECTSIVYLIDYNNIENNSFIVSNQYTFTEYSTKRADIVILINGLPLAIFELKSPSREETDISHAYRQLRNYMNQIPSLFIYNSLCVISDLATSKVGTITSHEDRFMEWKTKDGSYESTRYADFRTFFEGIFYKERFLDIIKNFICFNVDGVNVSKIVAGYHQYFAVRKAIDSTKKAMLTDGKGGVFWHTQGSGKSLSMVFYSKNLSEVIGSPTILVLTDRNDLDDQLFMQFSRCQLFLRQNPIKAESRKHLKELLLNRQANGIIFTTIQKFEENDEPLSERRNIIVVADEAHRSQYGLEEKFDMKSNKIKIGIARIIRNSLPNATYIGFTGTPISSKDKSTKEVFGDYIDIYDMTQAVEDGATRPVYYESRVIKLNLDEEILKMIDDEYDMMAQNTDEHTIEKSKRELGKLEAILGADQTIDSLVKDIIDHYENYRQHLLTGKAMIVAYSRQIAMKIYNKILELRPEWVEKIGVVMTQGNNDPEEWNKIIGNKAHKENLAKKFKDNNDPMKIAIVVDMWLTGFDVPSLATMYVYKPMEGHNLMQAIARVNRVFRDKEGGLVVDYIGIASALKKAMNDYTSRDKKNYGDPDVSKVAYKNFLDKLSICKDFFYGFDYSSFINGSDLQRAEIIVDATDFILEEDRLEKIKNKNSDLKKDYIKEAYLLNKSLSLCSSIAQKELRFEATFFEAVRVMLVRNNDTEKKTFSLKDVNARINNLLKQTIKSDGIINLFSDIKEEFSLFDPNFLQEIANMKQKNLSIELLKQIINEQVSVYKRTNVVKAEKFSTLLKQSMNRYINGMISNEEVREELMKMARDIKNSTQEGNKMGLSETELAFYDALTKPNAIRDFYENSELIAMTKELTELLRKNRTLDWSKKESARAKMRMLVKKLLRKYDYPPEGEEEVINTVFAQCYMWVENN